MFGHFVPLTGEVAIDSLHGRSGRLYCGPLTFGSLSPARFDLFAHAMETTDLRHRSGGRCTVPIKQPEAQPVRRIHKPRKLGQMHE